MTINTWNFATKLIHDIRDDMNAVAISSSSPLPTDDQVEAEVNRVFTLTNKVSGNYILRGPTNISNHNLWWVEDIRRLTQQRVDLIKKIFVNPSNLLLSPTIPTVVVTTSVKTPASGDLLLSSTAPTVVNTSTGTSGQSIGLLLTLTKAN